MISSKVMTIKCVFHVCSDHGLILTKFVLCQAITYNPNKLSKMWNNWCGICMLQCCHDAKKHTMPNNGGIIVMEHASHEQYWSDCPKINIDFRYIGAKLEENRSTIDNFGKYELHLKKFNFQYLEKVIETRSNMTSLCHGEAN